MALPGAPQSLTHQNLDRSASFNHNVVVADPVVTHYEYRLGGANGEWVEYDAPPHTITGLNNGETYPLAVRAVNSEGAGNSSNTTVTPTGDDGDDTNDNGWDDQNPFANAGHANKNFDWEDPDD
jgi:hypothetical protein